VTLNCAPDDEFKQRIAVGRSLDEILPDVFAVVREASVRTTGCAFRRADDRRDVPTRARSPRWNRRSKTLVATLPLFQCAGGKGLPPGHAQRLLCMFGLQQMGPIYHFWAWASSSRTRPPPGARSSCLTRPIQPNDDRYQNLRQVPREAYAADITYGTNNEFGFELPARQHVQASPRRSSAGCTCHRRRNRQQPIDEPHAADQLRTADKPSDYYRSLPTGQRLNPQR
jgi:preprotein translocase subunit SecA